MLWPLYSEQLKLLAQLPPGEAEAAEHRAALLVERGWGALRDWLEAPVRHPGERVAPPPRPAASGGMADLFDAA